MSKLSRPDKRKKNMAITLPPIPDKRYFSISEVSQLCAIKAYVLRYWEQEFSSLKPIKRRGNRRFYQEQDILLIRQIRKLLYEDGFTLEGARAQLAQSTHSSSIEEPQLPDQSNLLKKIIADLESVLHNLQAGINQSH